MFFKLLFEHFIFHIMDNRFNTFLFRSRANGEWMPLIQGNDRNIDEDVVSRMEIKVGWPFDDEMGDSGREKNSWANVSFAALSPHPDESEDPLDEVDDARDQKPFPEVGSVEEDEDPEGNVHQMSPVEDLESVYIQLTIWWSIIGGKGTSNQVW